MFEAKKMVYRVVMIRVTMLKYRALHVTERPARYKFYSIHAASHACHVPTYSGSCSLGRAFHAFERDTNTTTECASMTAYNDKERWNVSLYTLKASQDRAPQDRNLADTGRPVLRPVYASPPSPRADCPDSPLCAAFTEWAQPRGHISQSM